MAFKARNIIIFLIFLSPKGFGSMPVVDTARVVDTAKDTLAAASAVSELIDEFSGNLFLVQELIELKKIIKETEKNLRSIKQIEKDMDYVSSFNVDKYRSLSSKIRSLTKTVRVIKKLSKLATAGTGTEAANLMVNILRYEREKSQESFRVSSEIANLKHTARLRKMKVEKARKRRESAEKSLEYAENLKFDWRL